MGHPSVGEQGPVRISSVEGPWKRPSEAKLERNVWSAHVKSPFCETEDARRYLSVVVISPTIVVFIDD